MNAGTFHPYIRRNLAEAKATISGFSDAALGCVQDRFHRVTHVISSIKINLPTF